MSLIREKKPRKKKVYINWEHNYLVNGVDFYIINKIPFCVADNIKLPCLIYKLIGLKKATEDSYDNSSNSS